MPHPAVQITPGQGGELPPFSAWEANQESEAGLVREPLDAALPVSQLICEISSRLINAAEREVEGEVAAALSGARKALGLDRLCLLAFSEQKRQAVATHASYAEGISHLPETIEIGLLFSWADENGLDGELLPDSPPEDLSRQGAADRLAPGEANLTLPIHVGGSLHYLLFASHIRPARRVSPALIPALRLLGDLFANALLRCKGEATRREAEGEIARLKEKLQLEAEHLHAELVCRGQHEEIVGQSAALARTLALTEQVARTDSTVLIYGETGTGKELVAQAIHKLGMRRNKPMVKVNCASLPAALVESELFGREKGAYTGALTRQAGRFEIADGGTIFLDEIAEMSLELQAKLLRVLQEGQFERLGSARTIQVNVRVIAATNRNLPEEVRKGNFREDLYYRLNVFQIVVPPLRERVEDIPLLVWSFVHEFGEKMGKKINKITREDMAALQSYPWPGNVRELRNVVEHAVIVSTGERLQVRLPEKVQGDHAGIRTLEEYEVMHIREALRLTGGRIKGEGGAARLLGLNPSTLYSRMQKFGITQRPARDDISP